MLASRIRGGGPAEREVDRSFRCVFHPDPPPTTGKTDGTSAGFRTPRMNTAPTADAAANAGTWRRWHSEETPLRLGVSRCLLGEAVRFDGGHARDRFVTERLREWFTFVPVCPEMEIGLGAPRPSIRLVESEEGLRLVAPSTGQDLTERMQSYASDKVRDLQALDLDGFVLKKSSPSCGLERIRVYRNGAAVRSNETGLFAAQLRRDWPALPIEEEGRLRDPILREHFLERVFHRNRWRALNRQPLTRGRLVTFHTAHKLLIRAHDEAAYRQLGTLLGRAGQLPDEELFARYELAFQHALTRHATRRKHTNVLQHAMGHLKHELASPEREHLRTTIEDYRRGWTALNVPLSLLRYEIQRLEIPYLCDQLYFEPHPRELMLRNHA